MLNTSKHTFTHVHYKHLRSDNVAGNTAQESQHELQFTNIVAHRLATEKSAGTSLIDVNKDMSWGQLTQEYERTKYFIDN